MKIHTTNYYNTFIEVAEDCRMDKGEVPPTKGDKPTIAIMQYEILIKNPYRYSSDDVLFEVYAKRNDIPGGQKGEERLKYFSKGQACFRSSPLTKSYGWGIHFNEEGKMAIFGIETEEYEKLKDDKNLKVVKAMRSRKK